MTVPAEVRLLAPPIIESKTLGLLQLASFVVGHKLVVLIAVP
jgi:hypothetical protein